MSLFPIIAPIAAAVVSSSFTASGHNGGSARASVTFSGVSLGAADAARRMAVGLYVDGGGGITFSTVTIGGVSAAQAVNVQAVNGQEIAIWTAAVPSGTTGDIVVTPSVNGDNYAYAMWRLLGASSSASDTLTNTSEPATGTIDCPAGGVILGFASNDSAAATMTWAGITEDVDEAIQNNHNYAAAHDDFAAVQSGLTITADWATDASDGLVACSFGAA